MGIRQRSSGKYEARAHRNKQAFRLGTYETYEEAQSVYNEFIKDKPKISGLKHGMKYTGFYKCWQNMKTRCYNKSNKQYKDYGGRGISICDDWLECFSNFKKDMLDGYEDGLQIDRIDNDGNYNKENCRWVTGSLNCANKRKTTSTGVRKLPSGRFFACIKIEGTRYTIGTFDTEEIASLEFKKIHKEWYGF